MTFSFPYDWSRFPVAWFGANATHWESDEQLSFIGRHALAIFGWQHLITATNWTASVYAQLDQAAILKARFPKLPVYVYAGFGNANGYNAATWEVMESASAGCHGHQPCRKVSEPYTDWFLEAESTIVYSMSACEQMGLGYSNPPTPRCWNPIWNVANAVPWQALEPSASRHSSSFNVYSLSSEPLRGQSARDYFIERVVAPLADAPMIDGVFFDCFNFACTEWAVQTLNDKPVSLRSEMNCSSLPSHLPDACVPVRTDELPSPWNRRAVNIPDCAAHIGGPGCERLRAGTLDLARRVALTLNAKGKVPMFSNVGSFAPPKVPAPFWLDEARLVSALEGTAYQFNYEQARVHRTRPIRPAVVLPAPTPRHRTYLAPG